MSVKFKGKNITGVYIKNHEIIKAMFKNKVVYEKNSPEPPTPTGEFLDISKFTQVGTGTGGNITLGANNTQLANLQLANKQELAVEYKFKAVIDTNEVDSINGCLRFSNSTVNYTSGTVKGTQSDISDVSLLDGNWHDMSGFALINAWLNTNGQLYLNVETSAEYNGEVFAQTKVVSWNESDTDNGFKVVISKNDVVVATVYIKDIKATKTTTAGTLYELNDNLVLGSLTVAQGTSYKGLVFNTPNLNGGKRTINMGSYTVSCESGYTNTSNTPAGICYYTESGTLASFINISKEGTISTVGKIASNWKNFTLFINRNLRQNGSNIPMADLSLEWDEASNQLKVYHGVNLAETITFTNIQIYVY